MIWCSTQCFSIRSMHGPSAAAFAFRPASLNARRLGVPASLRTMAKSNAIINIRRVVGIHPKISDRLVA